MSTTIQMNPDDLAMVHQLLWSLKTTGPVVIKRAVDRTMGTVKTTVSRVARETLNVYKRDLDKSIGVKKYDYATHTGCVTIVGESLPVFAFKPVQTDMGVEVQIKKQGPTKVIRGAFIAKMESTHEGVFWREWHGQKIYNLDRKTLPPWKKLPRKYRLPMHEIFTTSLPEAMGDKVPMEQILADAEVNLHDNLERELNYELSKL